MAKKYTEINNNPSLHDFVQNVNEQSAASNAPKPATQPLSAEELAKLADMSKEQLIALVERMARQCGMVAAMTPKDTAQAMLDTLAAMVLCNDGEKKTLRDMINAATTWLDRVEGRPKQTVEANINLSYAMLLDQVNDKRDKMITIDG